MSYKVELVEKKDPVEQLEASKLSIKDLLNVLLNETKSFKYQITLKVTLKKYKPNREIEFRPVYFNSTTKLVINHKYSLENAFHSLIDHILAVFLERVSQHVPKQRPINHILFTKK